MHVYSYELCTDGFGLQNKASQIFLFSLLLNNRISRVKRHMIVTGLNREVTTGVLNDFKNVIN